MGGSASNVLTLNGGTVASNASRTFANTKFGGGIVIGGNVQFGELATVVSLANSTANLSFANQVNLGNSTRTFTQGNNGTTTFSARIFNGGLILARNAAASGQFNLTGANTFAGGLTLNSVGVNASGNNLALGQGAVTLTGTSATTLNLSAATVGNNFTIADSAGTKKITNTGSDATINGTITNNDSTGGFVIGATNGRTLTIGAINGNGTTGVTFGGTGTTLGGSSMTLVGTVVMNGAGTYTGNTVIDGSILRMSGAGSSVSAANLVFKQTAGSVTPTFDLNGTTQTVAGLDDSAFAGIIRSTLSGAKLVAGDSNNSTFAGTIISSTSLELEKVGSGKLTLTGANTYTNGTTITAGELQVSSQSLKGNVENNARLTFNQDFGDGTFAGDIGGSGSLTKKGANALTLSGVGTYSGGTTISAGTLEVSGAAEALTATSAVDISGGTLLLSGSAANRINNAAPISLGAATNSILRLSGAVTEAMGALTLSGTAARVIDFGSTSGVLTFASLAAGSGLPLQIWNWSGITGSGGGTDQITISSGSLGGSLALTDVTFYSDSGSTLYPGATGFTSNNELVPIPEASTLLGILGLMAPLAWRERRHWARCRTARV